MLPKIINVRHEKIQTKFIAYLIATLASFLLLIIMGIAFFSFYIDIQNTEIIATRLTSSWNFFNGQTKGLYFSDEQFISLEKNWRSGWESVEFLQDELFERSKSITKQSLRISKTLVNLNSAWIETSRYLQNISNNLENLHETSIGRSIVESGGISLNNINAFYLNGDYSEQEFFPISRLEKSIRILDTAGSVFNSILIRLKDDLTSYRIMKQKQYALIGLIITSLILLLTIIFIYNILKLNIYMAKKINVQTAELKDRLEDLKLTQSELVESRKQAAMLHLITGIAHEINTPLGVSITAESMLSEYIDDIKDNGDLLEVSGMISRNLNKINNLIQTLKNFIISSESSVDVQIDLVEFFQYILIEYKKYGIDNVNMLIPEGQNIISNPLNLTAAVKPIIQNWIDHNNSTQNNFYIICKETTKFYFLIFKDEGIGMKEQTQESCFDPFYTTGRGRGHVGLGLSLTENIIRQQLGGKIYCISGGLNKGSSFILRLNKDIKN